MKLILDNVILEVTKIKFAAVELKLDESTKITHAIELRIPEAPFWAIWLFKAKTFLLGKQFIYKDTIENCFEIRFEYLNEWGCYNFTVRHSDRELAFKDFAIVKEFAKKLENKHAMDIISK